MRNKKIVTACPLIALFVLIFLMHIKMNLNISDDMGFSQILKEKSILQHMANLYTSVNGKIFPDTMAAVFTYLPNIFFSLISSMMYTIIAYSISVLLLDNSIYSRTISAAAVLYLPSSLLISAGYVATSTNYIWTSAMLLFSLLPIHMYMEQKEIHFYQWCLFTISTLYAGNQEQTCVILIIIYIGIIVLKRPRFKQASILYYESVLSILSLCFILTAPGHVNRSSEYSIFRIPNWPQLDFIDKTYLGITTTISHFLNHTNILFALITVILMILVFQKQKNGTIESLGAFLCYSLFYSMTKLLSVRNYMS